jgi:tetratricopeptide (TPR) repeat protein
MTYCCSGSHIYKNNINKQSVVVKPYYHQTTNVMRSSILGTSYSWLAQYDKAIEAYNQALAIDPNHKKAKENLELAKNLKTEQK